LLHPCQVNIEQARAHQKVAYDSHTNLREYVIEDTVWVHNFRTGPHWVAGTVKKNIGRVMYEVNINGKDVTWCHHANQLRTRFALLPLTETTSATDTNRATTENPVPSEPVTLQRSTRIHQPRIIWVPI